MQNNFVFVDTETTSFKDDCNVETLSFKLGCAIFWNRETSELRAKTYYDTHKFWNDLEKRFSKDNKELILFAHNTKFDIKILDGYNELIKRNWDLKSHYVKNKTFIMTFEKQITKHLHYTLRLWDTMNYIPKSLQSLGVSVGYPKLKVDFDNVSDSELEIYCRRDTEIIYQFIRKFINFLVQNDLSRLKSTIGSISLNIFRHKFYNPTSEKEIIYIHNWKRAITLERESYKGGITDCFKIGSYDDVYKMDINGMYSDIMRKIKVPVKLLFNSHESHNSQDQLFKILNYAQDNDYGVIMKCTISLPKDNAYILHQFNGKSMFAEGKFKVSICTPEINFVLKYGKVDFIHHISVYRIRNIFKDFVGFFYELRIHYQKESNKINTEMCKLILNNQYGKWGQKEIEYNRLTSKTPFFKQNHEIIKLMFIRMKEVLEKNEFCYLGSIMNEGELYVVDKKIFFLKQTNRNTKDAFVGISSFITSYARMSLINYLKIAKRENVYYCDTDSLFTNDIGYNNLEQFGCIDKYELGKLKNEHPNESTYKVSFYSPKFYDLVDSKDVGIFENFLKERKCKGIKKGSVLIKENDKKATYQVQVWRNFKADLKNGTIDKQIINLMEKVSNKVYDKGKVDINGNVIPYNASEIVSIFA